MSPRRPAGSRMVGLFARLVPAGMRRRFIDEWQAELAAATRDGRSGLRRTAAGSLRDALWLMRQSWRPDTLRQDIGFAVRTWRRRPGTALVIVAVLAIGIGATVAMFGVVDAVLLSPLPFRDPDRLIRIYMAADERGALYANLNPLDLRDIAEQADSVDGVGYMTFGSETLTGIDEPVRLSAGYVSANYFDVLGVTPPRGRSFTAAEDDPGNGAVVLLSFETWRDRFGGRDDVIGSSLTLSGRNHTVIGVLPRGYDDPLSGGTHDVWLPLEIDPETQGRGGHFVRAVARIRDTATVEQASAEAGAIFENIVVLFDKRGPGRRVWATSLHETLVRDLRPLVVMLGVAVALVLLIACANVAGLMVASGVERGREIAVRRALGAGRGRLLRQLASESLLLSLVGGGLGVALAAALLATATRWLPAEMPGVDTAGLDARALCFSAVTLLGTTLLFGTLPALALAGERTDAAMREGSRSVTGGPAQQRLRSVLVISEIALTVTLLAAFALTLLSVRNLSTSDYGFDPAGRLAVTVSLPESTYPEYARVDAVHAEIDRRLAALPGVVSAGAVNRRPLSESASCDGFVVESNIGEEPGSQCAEERTVSGRYFEAMGIELLAGRVFEDGDDAGTPRVVVVTRAFVDRWLGGVEAERALGARFLWGHPSYFETDDGSEPQVPWRTIVGVVEDVRHFGVEAEAVPEVYMPHAQYPYARSLAHVLHTSGEPESMLPVVRNAIGTIDPDLPLFDVTTMTAAVRARSAERRAAGTLLGGFAALGLVLSAVGIYGVLAASVASQRREFGVRLALGARPTDVILLVTRRGVALALTGAVVGVVLVQATSRWLASLLFGVTSHEPAVVGAVVAAVLVIAAAAALIPARRAARVGTTATLRDA